MHAGSDGRGVVFGDPLIFTYVRKEVILSDLKSELVTRIPIGSCT